MTQRHPPGPSSSASPPAPRSIHCRAAVSGRAPALRPAPTISLHRKGYPGHRLAWTLRYGTIPEGFMLCHRCDERRCINPDHHFVGTHQENMADRAQTRRARLDRAAADLFGEGGPLPEARPEELTPMRLYLRGVEITGKVLIRPFVPGAPRPARRAPAGGGRRRPAPAAR